MIGPSLEFPGGSTLLTALSFRAELDAGWSGEALLAEGWPGVHSGVRAKLLLGGRSFDIVVRQYHAPWRGTHGSWIAFCDPISFEPPLNQSVFASSGSTTSFAQVVTSRHAVQAPDEFSRPQFPQVIVDGLSLMETLHHMIGRLDPAWHWQWREDKIQLGPLPAGGAVDLETSNEVDLEGGFEADLHLDLPQLGDRVKAAGPGRTVREGNVTQIRIQLPDRPLVCRIRVAEKPLPPVAPPQPTGSLLREATVTGLDPLMVRVHLPSGDTSHVRGRLFALQMQSCRLGLPLQVNDRVLVEWPMHALTTDPLLVFAEGETTISKALQLRSPGIDVFSRDLNIDELRD